IRYKFSYSAPGYTPFEQTLKLKLAPEPNVQDIDLSPAAAAAAAAQPAPPTADPAIMAYNEGAALANEGKVPEAIAKIEEAVAKLINASTDSEAEPLLKSSIAADDKFANAYYELGMIYVRAGKNADARTNLQKYLELDPNGKDAATAKEMLNYVK